MNKTKIEYLNYTWNPIAMRCTPVSIGCANCWHLSMAKRLAGNPKICNEFRNAYAGAIPPVLIHTKLEAPLHLRKPARIGVQFMGDFFHEKVTDAMIDSILRVMDKGGIRSYGHKYFLITKRVERMADFLIKWYGKGAPIENLYLGVSVEDQKTADERIPILLKIPAAHRWVSIEPMLGPVDLAGDDGGQHYFPFENEEGTITEGIDWVVLGGETGPKARPLHPDWVRSVRDQCQAAGVPFFFKSWGDWFTNKGTGRLLDGREWNEMPEGIR